MYRRVHVIINPAAGQDSPILSVLNRVFHPAGIDWEVFVTKQAGDAHRYARQAVAAGVDAVAVNGGDGTVIEVASALVGTRMPLAILPGGTANVIAAELGIPGDLAEACALANGGGGGIRSIDMGQVGQRYFLIRVGVGFEAEMIAGADRETKQRLGVLAYALSGLQALRQPTVARYRLTLDDQEVETEGITCMIANAGSVGQLGLSVVSGVEVSDGLLDVIVVRKADLASLLAVAASMATGSDDVEPLQHWQARQVTIVSDPPQIVQIDGEVDGETPVSARVVPDALHVIVPPGAVGAREAA